MFKYRLSALARLLVYHALAMVFLQGLLSAQVTLPPIIGDSLWTHTWRVASDMVPDYGSGGAACNALAEGARLLFRASRAGFMVLRTDDGTIVDRISMADIDSDYVQTQRIYCDRMGSNLLVFYVAYNRQGVPSFHMAIISYPDKKLLKEFLFQPVDLSTWDQFHGVVSPNGRWVILPYRYLEGKPYILYDLQRDTAKVLHVWGGSSWSFTADSKVVAYAQFNYSDTGKLTLIDLSDTEPAIRSYTNTARYRDPKISADGNYVVAKTSAYYKSIATYPQLTVIDCNTAKEVWKVSGGRELWSVCKPRYDLINYAISAEGRYVYAYHNDTLSSGFVINEGLFYRMPDSIPIARAVHGTIAGNGPEYEHVDLGCGFTSFSSDLRRAYAEANNDNGIEKYKCDIVAMQFDDLITGMFGNESATGSSHIIYPNPTTGSLTLNWTNSHETVYWQLLDTSGSILFYASSPVMNGKVQLEIPQSLAIGRYSLLVRDATARTVEHHVVIKN
jgi:hypothetical protein